MAEANQLVPDISLGVRTPQAASGPLGGDPLRSVLELGQIQNTFNQNRLFQLQFAGRQRWGEILSGPGSLEDKLSLGLRDPAASQVPDFVNTIRASMVSQQDLANKVKQESQIGAETELAKQRTGQSQFEVAKGRALLPGELKGQQIGLTSAQAEANSKIGAANNSAWEGATKAIAAGWNDPSKAQAALDLYSKRLPPGQQAMLPVMQKQLDMLREGNPTREEFQSRVLASQVAAGVTPESVRQLSGVMPPGIQTMEGSEGQKLYVPVGGGILPAPNALGAVQGGSTASAPGGSGNPPALAVGQTTQAREQATENAKSITETRKEMDDRIATAPGQLNNIDVAVNAMKNFQAGGGTDFRLHLAQIAQAAQNLGVPIDNKTINSISSPNAGELYAGQILKNMIQQIAIKNLSSPDTTSKSRVFSAEVKTTLDNLGPSADPKALLGILNNIKFHIQENHQQAKKFYEFQHLDANAPARQGYGNQEFYGWYDNNYAKPPEGEKLGKSDVGMGPIPEKGVKGLTISHDNIIILDPKTGKFIPKPKPE